MRKKGFILERAKGKEIKPKLSVTPEVEVIVLFKVCGGTAVLKERAGTASCRAGNGRGKGSSGLKEARPAVRMRMSPSSGIGSCCEGKTPFPGGRQPGGGGTRRTASYFRTCTPIS